jgi:ubiquinone/menaquinone biosynthesis C-methylase UbiE
MPIDDLPVTVVITTKDRRDDLARLLPTVLAQTMDCEILVVDDGSSDGTSALVRERFPDVRLERSDKSLGYIVQRTRAASLARGRILVSLDDDAVLPSSRTIEQTLADFDHPRIGAVAIPVDDVRGTGEVRRQRPPDVEGRWLADTYMGTAHAVRRDVFLGVGGYWAALGHQVEELDFCLRMLGEGYVVRLGRADPLRHLESPRRNIPRLLTLTARNELLNGWHNVPLPYLPVRWAKVLASCAIQAVEWREPGALAKGAWQGLRDSFRLRADRQPVSRAVYRVNHDLRKRGPLRLEQVEGRLPPTARNRESVPEREAELIAANVRGYRRNFRSYERRHGEIFNPREQSRLRRTLERALGEVEDGDRQPRVLDFGCGSGNVTSHLLDCGARVVAADISPSFLTYVQRRYAGQPVEPLALNGRDLDGLPDGSVDAAVAYSVLHHIPDYLKALRELCRVVRPGGVLVIDHEAAPREYSGDPDLAAFRARVVEHERAQPKSLRRFLDPWHYRSLSSHYLLHLRRRLGNPRYWPEGDIHIWPDDHIEWERVEEVMRDADFEVVAREDYLLYRSGTPEPLYEEYRTKTADVRLLVARRHAAPRSRTSA